ncbi:MAG: iron chelate uptake ABC transporter family permease subunit, partial [Quinella sp. 3Q1]|nr:iron chelate uptake ABC transporter family permease subunit [Quinella sp. 3Q1]
MIKIFLIATATVAGFFLSLTNGSVEISAAQIFGSMPLDETQRQILENIRLPRTIVAMLVGVNLSLSGAILQAVMKNPLADPHIIGISSGAGLFGIFVMMIFSDAGALVTPA